MLKETFLLAIYIVVLGIIVVYRKWNLLRVAMLAFLISLIWALLAQSKYGYVSGNITLFGINIYALIGWSLGLFIAYALYSLAQRQFRFQHWSSQLALLNAVYIPLLIIAEAIAYHVFGVVNLVTASYDGLPICDCMHAPPWMQAVYLAMGSVYFALIKISRLDMHSTHSQKTTARI